MNFDGEEMAEVFRAISEHFVFSTKQLLLLLDVIDGKYLYFFNSEFCLDAKWRAYVYLSGIARVHDFQAYDFIKHKAKYPEVMQILYK